MHRANLRITSLLSVTACAAVVSFANAQTPTPPTQKPVDAPASAIRPRPSFGPPKPEIKPYKEVITAEAKTQEGLFKVHRIDDRIYWEIPKTLFGRDMLWQTEIAEAPQGLGFIGFPLGYRIVRFERHEKKIFVRAPSYAMRSEGSGALAEGVAAASLPPIVAAFNIEAEGPDKSAVIEVTSVFLTDQSDFVAGPRVGTGVDPSRSYIEKVTAFPTNIETRSFLTVTSSGGLRTGRTVSATILVDASLVLLPDKPMTGRYADSRVGYFSTSFELYGSPKHRVEDKELIERFRLEKKDPAAEVSDPVKPITFYLSREVPEAYRPAMKKGIENWNEAFLKAGFSNAIVCRDAPTAAEDPSWDPEDARYSVVRWAPSQTANAMGPHIVDPRSGEVISAHVIVWHNLLQLAEEWYFCQAGATDIRAQKLPLPDEVMSKLVEVVITHEVGHTLGLMHNFKASSAYTTKQLRDPEFTKANGLAASIMDYARFNYVAQPGDGAALVGRLGPYDRFAIEWGYKPIPGAIKPEDETAALDLIASRQVSSPELRFDGDLAGIRGVDPTAQMEDIGDDPVEATRLGLENIRRISRLLVPATTPYGEDYDLLLDTYAALLGQRALELGHVIRLVGGVVTTDYHAGRGKDVFSPVPAAKQEQAVRFLMDNMKMPPELSTPEILNKISPSGAVRLSVSLQASIIRSLFNSARVQRMFDNEAVNGRKAYSVDHMVLDVQSGIWSELAAPKPAIDPYRRSLQRSYLDMMDARVNGDGATASDLKGIARHNLKLLAKQIDRALPKSGNLITTEHLDDSRKQIERILEGKTDQGGGVAGALQLVFGGGFDDDKPNLNCWADPITDSVRQFLRNPVEK